MMSSNNHPSTPSSSRRSKNPKYKRIVVGHRWVPMTPEHVDALASANSNYHSPRGNRCRYCWLKTDNPNHTCMKRLAQDQPLPNHPMLEVPIYEWVKIE